MNKLTTTEKKVLNNMSKVLDVNVKLGDKVDEIIGLVGETGTPVNAVAAVATLNVTGVSIDGETITINNPTKVGTDVYEFLADAAQTKTSPTNIAIDITTYTAKATGTLTVDTQPISGDTLTIGTNTYIFVPVGTAKSAGEISIGANLAEAKTNIVAAINGTDTVNLPHPKVTAGAFAVNACTITALIGGTIGNAIATTETFTAGTNIFAAATLGSGTNCTTANTVIAIVNAITASDTQGVGAVSGAGNTVVLTADIAGVVGNDIAVAKVMTNAAFANAAVKLAGGIDGTVASGTKFMMDASYLYTCLNGNTTADKNWRRVAIGAAY